MLTLRADFLPAALSWRPLVELLQRGHYLLGPPSEEEYRAVIEEPARRRGVALEDGLGSRILNDVLRGRGSLPLLEFALGELWQHQRRRLLTHQAYDAIGGVAQALANHAEATFATLGNADRRDAERILLQLVQPGQGQEDTRRVAAQRELGEHWPLVSRLASAPARLLVTGRDESGEPTVEIVHEALIRHWGRLRALIDAHRAFRSWQEHLRRDVRRWLEQRDEGYLLRGFPLAEAKVQLERHGEHLGADERAFLAASIALEERQRAEQERRRRERRALRRLVTRTLATALVVAVALAGVAGWQWRSASRKSRELAQREADLAVALRETEVQRDQLAAQGEALTVALGDAERQRLQATYRGLEGHALAALQQGDEALAALLAAEGLRLAGDEAGARQNFLTVLLAMPARLRATLQGSGDGLDFSPDGTVLAVSGATIKLWDPKTLELVDELGQEGSLHNDVAFSPDGRMLASASGNDLLLWDVERREQIGEPLRGHTEKVLAVAFSPDGTKLASGAQDRTTILWDVVSHEMIGQPLESGSGATWINSVRFSPDGKMVASGEIYSDISLWDVDSGELLGLLRGHQDSVGRVAFSPDGTLLASVSWDGTARVWDVARQQPVGEPLTAHDDAVLGVAFSPDGKVLATASYDKSIILWDVATLTPIGEPLRGGVEELRPVTFSPDGRTLVAGTLGGTVQVWDLGSNPRVASPLELDSHTEGLALAPDGRTLATSSWNGKVTFWDAAGKTPLDEIDASPQGYANSVAFSPDGRLLASNEPFADLAILWDAETHEAVAELGPQQVWTVTFSPDGRLLATGGWYGDVGFWDVASGQALSDPVPGHGDTVRGIAFSPDGRYLASSSADSTVRLWDVATRTPLGDPLIGHTSFVNAVAFSPDSTLLATAGSDHDVILWEVPSGRRLGEPLHGHEKEVRSVAFHPSGRYLASAGDDGAILFWDLAQSGRIGEPLAMPYPSAAGEITKLVFTPDGEVLISAGEAIEFWDGTPDPVAWQERSCRLAGRNFTAEEWAKFLGELPYQPTCPEFPYDETLLGGAEGDP